jgi:chromatin modification-related protein EAF6
MSNAPEPASHAPPIDKPPTAIAMTENKPPTDAQASAASNADQPGRPYYEQLRTTLRGTLDKKRKLDDQLAALEDQIFKLEGAYLEETSNSGNIVRGFDGWVKGVSVGGRAGDDRRRGRVRDEDRVFSHSSVGWMKVRTLRFSENRPEVSTARY